jgi:hypothetical protein
MPCDLVDCPGCGLVSGRRTQLTIETGEILAISLQESRQPIGEVIVYLEEPQMPVVRIDTVNDPSLGPAAVRESTALARELAA